MTDEVHVEQLTGDVDELAEQLLDRADADQAQLLGPDGLLTQLTQRVLNRALDTELAEHLGYEKGDPAGRGSGNNRNGSTPKTVLTDIGAVSISVPRDRAGDFDPQIVPSMPGGWLGSTSRSSACMRAACRCGTSARTSRSSTVSR